MVIFHSCVSLPEGIISILEIHEVLLCPSSNADGATSQHSNGNNWAVEKCNQDMAWKSMHARTYYNYVCCICVHMDICIYIYIHISHVHECVNAHVSQANALLKLNTRPLKKTLFKRSCSVRNCMKMALFWLKSQFHPISASSFHNSNPKFCGWNPHWKGPENGWNRPNIPGFFPPVFPSARWTFDFRQLWSHRRLWGAVEGWRWQSICNQYVMVVNITPVSLGKMIHISN